MDLYKLILRRRTVRKFQQKKIDRRILRKIVNAGRLAPSAANLQFIEYVIIDDMQLLDKIFPYTRWAGYIKPLWIPSQDERAVTYVAILINLKKSSNPDLRDIGASAENIILSALNFGLGSCWLGAIDKEKIAKILNLPSHIRLDSLIALGYPKESPRKVEQDNVKYWRDGKGRHYVPKRPLNTILFYNSYGNKG
ncbi:MAG: hypothetical protein B6D53_01695 [Candidatus Omnitrophica bacterium 4484_49]|nr:MAG: hypothetical protein B6D53_01695 [Candidatus Omnitrophica bacterium 4484_49]